MTHVRITAILAAILLALACFAVVVQTFRLRFVSTSAAFALQLSRAATLAAILRTVDGAQNLVINAERLAYWQQNGAQLSPTVARLAKQAAKAAA